MMLRVALLASAACVAFGASSFAADLPTRKGPPPAPVVAPAFSWTGLYAGLNLGGAWGSTNIQDNYPLGPLLGIPASQTISASGVIGGAQLGYNYQIGNFVIGGELEFDGVDLQASKSVPLNFGLGTDARKSDADWVGTAGLRLGYAVDRLLFYAKGGGAVADYHYRDQTASLGGVVYNNATDDEDRWGWLVGGGVEWAFANNWTAKAEYDYIGFDRQSVTLNSVGGVIPAAIPLGISNSISIAKVGVNYKF